MKCRLFFILLGVILASGACARGLVFETERIEIAAGWDDTEKKAVFHFVNESDEEIFIQRVHTSCGCTAAAPAKRNYAPGEPGSIEASFTIGSRQGSQSNRITVTTNQGAYQLLFRIDVPTAWILSQRVLAWRMVEGIQSKEVELQVLHPDVTDVAVLREAEGWDVELERVNDNTWRVVATPEVLEHNQRQSLILQLSREDEPHLLANLFLRVL